MKRLFNFKVLTTILVVFFVFGTFDASAQRRKPTIQRRAATRTSANLYTVQRGERIRVRMNETLSSKTARVGDTFTTDVTEPVYSTNGVVVIPVGSKIVGRVNSVTQAKKGGDPGKIDVRFTEVKLPNGTRRSINGSLTDLDTKKAKSDNEGGASGDDRKNDKLIFIGGGAGGGAILGGLIGGGKGAAIGAILGGLGGFAGERLTKGEDAEVKSGTEFGIYLNQSASFPKFGATETYSNETAPNNANGTTAGGQTYVVQPGDTLGKISSKFYGTSRRYNDIYNANRNVMSSPSQLEVGQELIIP